MSASLREFLDAGGNPRESLGEDHFTRMLDDYNTGGWARITANQRLEDARFHRHAADMYEREGCLIPEQAQTAHRRALEGFERDRAVQRQTWEADLIEDPALIERLLGFLDGEELDHFRREADLWRRPYPLVVDIPETRWACGSCGDEFDQGTTLALWVTYREGHSEGVVADVNPFCFSCVSMVYEAMKAAQS